VNIVQQFITENWATQADRLTWQLSLFTSTKYQFVSFHLLTGPGSHAHNIYNYYTENVHNKKEVRALYITTRSSGRYQES